MSWPTGINKRDFYSRFSAIATAISERSTLCGGLGMSISQQAYKKTDGTALTSLSQMLGAPFLGPIMKYNFEKLAANIKTLFDGGSGSNVAAWREDDTTGHASATLWTWANIITDVGLGAWDTTPNIMLSTDWMRMQGVLDRMCYPRVLCKKVTNAGTSTGDSWYDGGAATGDTWVDFITNGVYAAYTARWPRASWAKTTFVSPPFSYGVYLFNGPQPTGMTTQVSGMAGVQTAELALTGGGVRDNGGGFGGGTALTSPPDLIVTVNGVAQTIEYDGSFSGKYYEFSGVTPSNIYMEHDPAVSTTTDPFPTAINDARYEISADPTCWAYLDLTSHLTDQA